MSLLSLGRFIFSMRSKSMRMVDFQGRLDKGLVAYDSPSETDKGGCRA